MTAATAAADAPAMTAMLTETGSSTVRVVLSVGSADDLGVSVVVVAVGVVTVLSVPNAEVEVYVRSPVLAVISLTFVLLSALGPLAVVPVIRLLVAVALMPVCVIPYALLVVVA